MSEVVVLSTTSVRPRMGVGADEQGETVVLRLAGYDRISDDKAGDEKGVERQNGDYTGKVHAFGWEIGRRYSDNDKSAYKRSVKRKEFEQMLIDLKSGAVDGVAAYDLDRIARQPRDLERLIDIYEANPRLKFVTVTQDHDLSTPDGRTMARIMVAIANKSSADTARRVARKQLERAEEGLPPGGFAPFGWKDDKKTFDTREAAEIRDAHERILAGVRLGTIRRDWVERGIHTRQMKARGATKVSYNGLKTLLTNWRLCGYRIHRGEVLRDKEGNPVIGQWDAIVTPDRLIAVRAALEGNGRAPGSPKLNRALTYLLSGIARCGVCGSRMRGQVKPTASKDTTFVYQCVPTEGGCGKSARRGNAIDAMVIEYIMTRAAEERQGKQLVTSWPLSSELAQVRDDIAALEEARDAPDPDERMAMRDFIRYVNPLNRRVAELETERARWETEQAIKANVAEIDLSDWDDLGLERQRAAVLQRIECVIVHPAGRGARKFNPDLIEIVPAKTG